LCNALGVTLGDFKAPALELTPDEHAEICRKLRAKISKNELCGEVPQTTMDKVYKGVNNRFPPGRFAPELKVMI